MQNSSNEQDAQELKDLGSFTFSIQIGDSDVVHALSDLSKNINLMSLSIFNTLGLGKLRLYSLVLQLADRTRAVAEE